MSKLGSTVRALRTKRGLSLVKLSAICGLSKAHIHEIEKGRADNPSANTLGSLALALGVPATDLFRAAMK
jgi:XRE family transcriptional regulator, regulator of sulfur utilization